MALANVAEDHCVKFRSIAAEDHRTVWRFNAAEDHRTVWWFNAADDPAQFLLRTICGWTDHSLLEKINVWNCNQ